MSLIVTVKIVEASDTQDWPNREELESDPSSRGVFALGGKSRRQVPAIIHSETAFPILIRQLVFLLPQLRSRRQMSLLPSPGTL